MGSTVRWQTAELQRLREERVEMRALIETLLHAAEGRISLIAGREAYERYYEKYGRRDVI